MLKIGKERIEKMTNYEKYKDEIDAIMEKNRLCAIDRNTHKFVECCVEIGCENCLFSAPYNNDIPCYVNICKWLVAEYKGTEVDWSKISIDTPVLVNDNRFQGGNAFWIKMHFAGVDTKGNPLVYSNGRSSWSNGIKPIVLQYDDIKLAEVDNEWRKI